MSTWPSGAEELGAIALLQEFTPGQKPISGLWQSEWPDVKIRSALPAHVVKVCAVAIHRDELLDNNQDTQRGGVRHNIPGYEFSGYVVSASPRSPLKPGTKVYGRTSFLEMGNARTYVATKFHELAVKPSSMTWEQAATAPIGGLIAFQGLFGYKLLRQPSLAYWGRRRFCEKINGWCHILITGAATPAGVWAVQLARVAGAGRIVATCDAENMDLVRRLGAHEVYDWTQEGSLRDWKKGTFSAVFDLMGGQTLTRAWRLVAKRGRILTVAHEVPSAKPKVVNPNIKAYECTLKNSPQQLHLIATLAERGLVRPVCDSRDVFELDDHEEAMERLSGHQRGQVVLKLDSSYPAEEIITLSRHGDEFPQDDFTIAKIEKASKEDPPEQCNFSKWLRTQGSNHPDLAQPTETELMPPPPVCQARSKLREAK